MLEFELEWTEGFVLYLTCPWYGYVPWWAAIEEEEVDGKERKY